MRNPGPVVGYEVRSQAHRSRAATTDLPLALIAVRFDVSTEVIRRVNRERRVRIYTGRQTWTVSSYSPLYSRIKEAIYRPTAISFLRRPIAAERLARCSGEHVPRICSIS